MSQAAILCHIIPTARSYNNSAISLKTHNDTQSDAFSKDFVLSFAKSPALAQYDG